MSLEKPNSSNLEKQEPDHQKWSGLLLGAVNKFLESIKQKIDYIDLEYIQHKVKLFIGAYSKEKTLAEIKAFRKKLDERISFNQRVNNFYRKLIPQSLKKPDLIYKSPVYMNKSDISLARNLGKLQTSFEETNYNFRIKKQIIEALHPHRGSLEGHHLLTDDKKYEYDYKVFKSQQDGGYNLIQENFVRYSRVDNNSHGKAQFTHLEVTNPNLEFKFDLESLLPQGAYFSPSIYDPEKKDISVVSLSDYSGTKDSRCSFFATPEVFDNQVNQIAVSYGDLTEKGGLLSLLHEISHAWQAVYYQDFSHHDFKKFIESLTAILNSINIVATSESTNNNISNRERQKIIQSISENLSNLGVEQVRRIYNKGELKDQELDQNEFSIADYAQFIVKSSSFNEILKGYEREERDAWAHAIKALRFLRSKGVDLEPELKTLTDIKEYIHNYLASYQIGIENIVKSGRGIKFTRWKEYYKE